MNSDVKSSILKLKEIIENSSEYKEYFNLKNAILNNENLCNLKLKLDNLKKCKMSDEEKENYLKLNEEFESNILVVNFKNAKRNYEDLLLEIKKELEL